MDARKTALARHHRHSFGYQWLEDSCHLELRSALWPEIRPGTLSNERYAQLLSASSAAALAALRTDALALNREVEVLLNDGSS